MSLGSNVGSNLGDARAFIPCVQLTSFKFSEMAYRESVLYESYPFNDTEQNVKGAITNWKERS